ncbi:MAG: Fe-S cluster assembly protein HesB, partial [Candidatus Thorarchaeota archaeon]|nr:Fe-S cluster assembly protein HesB [Candidatus Thorarchaeota archaeon]
MHQGHSQKSIEDFQQKVMSWWCENARDLPWRRDPTPYQVLVSEIMLQQTQVNRVIPKYLQFMEEFPTLDALASAETKHLLKIWRGLGYNRRAIWLRESAAQIVERGSFPQEVDELRKLRGIGPYTSRSILIFAFNKDVAAVDTNIRRVLIASGFATEEMTECQIQEVADSVLLKGRSSDWHNALMDYGSDVLTSSQTGIAPISRQSDFKGSTRQIRGIIIRLLTERESMTLEQLLTELELDSNRDMMFS